MRLRIMTYNIHKGIGGVDRRYKLGRIVETIAHYDPDIVFLQEVDDGVPRSSSHRQVDLLGDSLHLPYRAFQKNVRVKAGAYGNAILSRYPLEDTRSIDLTIPLKKRRRAIVSKIPVGPEPDRHSLIVANFHLGLAGFERIMQLRRFLAHEIIQKVPTDVPLVVGGDFNDVFTSLFRRIMQPYGFQPAAHLAKTFPAMMPMRSLDQIYFRGPLTFIDGYVGNIRQARLASDHLPLIAEFQWTA